MAKTNEPNLIERHVEKVVLAVTVVVLILALVFRVASSPRHIQLTRAPGVVGAKDAYSPKEVDQALEEMAEQVKKRIESYRPPPLPKRDYLAELKTLRERPFDPTRLRSYQNWRAGREPAKPVMEQPEGPKLELANLLPVLAPEAPLVKVRREVQVVAQAGGRVELKEAIATHAAAVFEYGEVLKKWREKLEKTYVPAVFVVLTVEAERRYQLLDGSWSQPEPVSMVRLPKQVPLPALPPFDGKNLREVRYAIQLLAQIDNQEYIVQPPYYDIYWPNRQPGTWLINKPRTRVSDLLAGSPTTLPAGTPRLPRYPYPPRPMGPYPGMPGRQAYPAPPMPGRIGPEVSPPMPPPPPASVGPGRTGRTRRVPSRVPRVSGGSRRGRPGRSPRVGGGSRRGGASRIPRAPRGPSGPPMPPEAPMPPPIDMPRQPLPPRTGGMPGPMVELPEIVQVPSLQEQLSNPKGIMEVWFHDTNLTEGKTYSYRLRLVLLNPLFGYFRAVAKDDDAKQVAVKTDWSDWSEPAHVKRPTEFFLAGRFLGRGASVKVFRRKWGQWVEHSFNVSRGEPIGKEVPKQLIRLDTGQLETTMVDFRTGAIAVDFDFDRPWRVPNTNFVRKTIEMLYLGPDGKLRSRVGNDDMASERYKELLKASKQAAAMIASASAGMRP